MKSYPSAKIVEEIRQKFATGKYNREALRLEYRLTDRQIYGILSHKRWKFYTAKENRIE